MLTFFAHCNTIVFKILKIKYFKLIHNALLTLLFFLQRNALIFIIQVIFVQKVFKLQSYKSVTLHLCPKNPNLEVRLKIKPKQIKMLFLKKKILSDLVIKLVKLLVFERILWLIGSNWFKPTKNGFQSQDGSNIGTRLYDSSESEASESDSE